jgi:tetratricopeptide (TPR) repeat protein
MRRAFLVTAVLVVAGVAAALSYQAAARARDYRALVARGDQALRDDQTFAAIEAYSGALALRPDSMLAYLRRAETYRRRGDVARGDLEAAAKDLRSAAALDPAAPRPLEELGDVYYALQRYERAAETYERVLHLDDRAAGIAYKLALARYREGNLAAAIAAARQALAGDPRLANAQYLLGLCFRDQHLLPDAQRAFERAVELAPGMIPAREELADIYAARGRRAEEIEQLQLIAALDRGRVERQVAVGLAHARAGHGDLAVLTLSSAVERAADPAVVYGALGRIWLQRAEARNDRVDLSKALEALERVAATASATSDILTLYGRALLLDGEVDVAERILEDATRRYPLDPAAFKYYAEAAERQGHLEIAREALVSYDRLVGEEKDFAPRATSIAALSVRLADPDTAAEWLRRASSKFPNDVRLLALLADAQIRSGDRAAAAATVAKGFEKDPNNAALAALAARIRRAR